jgi:acyl-CoA thioester hydrolase
LPSRAQAADRAYYAAWERERVRFSDTDAMGHVNNVAYVSYVETGRVALGRELAGHAGEEVEGFILARLEIDYLGELHYPAEIDVGSRVVRVGRTSYVVASGIFEGERCVATAESVLVMLGVDGPTPIISPLREMLEALAEA